MSTLHETPSALKKYLDEQQVPYQIIPHMRDYSAQKTAADTHTPGRQFAKCVLLWIDNYYAMVVIPADERIDFQMLNESLGARGAGLISEPEMHRLFPDCELGAEPPFGNLYDLPVYVDSTIAEDEIITFNAGTHDEAIRMPFAEFERITEPTIIRCATKTMF